MIRVKADGENTKVTITGEGPIAGWNFSFLHGSCKWQAQLLAHQLDLQIAQNLEHLKCQFYNLGVKHGRAKRRLIKDDEFFGDWRFDEQDIL